MPDVRIVSDEIVSKLVAVGPQKFATAEALEFKERTSGVFDPAPELLRETIDAVFWASLCEEEGKPALARVLFADIRNPDCRLRPRKVSSDAIRKLSPLLDVPSNALLISKDATIVGVGQWHNLEVGIVAPRPGRLVVLDGHVVLGVFEKGQWVVVGGTSIDVMLILQRALPEEPFRDRLLKATLITRLAMAARRAGRGATFVILPADQQCGIGSVSYEVDDFLALPNALEAWRRASASTPPAAEREQIDRLARRAITIAGAGAGIDGATLIDASNLRLLGFGAKINARDADFDMRLIELPNRDVQRIKKQDSGGMRHQTAARLVHENHAATVITVSQDGPVSLFVWHPGASRVAMFKHLDRYFEAEASFGL